MRKGVVAQSSTHWTHAVLVKHGYSSLRATAMTINEETIFEYDLDVTGATDYGVSMDAIFGGQEKVPLQGARFDIAFAGPVRGRVSGLLRGVDYLHVRADGRRELDIRATIETSDRSRIAFSADGIATPREHE